jgi:hypothetical protein
MDCFGHAVWVLLAALNCRLPCVLALTSRRLRKERIRLRELLSHEQRRAGPAGAAEEEAAAAGDEEDDADSEAGPASVPKRLLHGSTSLTTPAAEEGARVCVMAQPRRRVDRMLDDLAERLADRHPTELADSFWSSSLASSLV